jgi:four helix bundle protein
MWASAAAMAYKTFEDLELYKTAREFRKAIYNLIKSLPDEEKFNLVSQMRRAATSLTNNIAEGNGRYHYQESIQFCRQARGSLAELIDDINICIDQKYFPEKEMNELKQKAHEINKLLNGFIAYLKRSKASDT